MCPSKWSGWSGSVFKVIFATAHAQINTTPIKFWAATLFLMSCMHTYVATPSYNLCSYLAMATATSSITDSTVQDDIPQNPHHPVNYKFPKCTFGQKKAVSCAFQSAWFSQWLKDVMSFNQLGVWLNHTHGQTSSQVLAMPQAKWFLIRRYTVDWEIFPH